MHGPLVRSTIATAGQGTPRVSGLAAYGVSDLMQQAGYLCPPHVCILTSLPQMEQCLSHFLVTETYSKHPQVKRGNVYFGSQCEEGSVHGQQAPKLGSRQRAWWRRAAQGVEDRKQREEGGAGWELDSSKATRRRLSSSSQQVSSQPHGSVSSQGFSRWAPLGASGSATQEHLQVA